MKVRTYALLLAALFLATALLAQAQEPMGPQGGGGGAAQSGAPGASVVPASSVDTQGIRKYVIGPGDTLDVRVFGQPDLNWTGEVDDEGNLSSLPFIETPIHAQCRTDKEIQKDVIVAYSKFLRRPQISVRVTGRNSRTPAVIFGAVAAPTRVSMYRRVRLNEIITTAGGYTERANGDVQILHTEPLMCPDPGEEPDPVITDSGLAARAYKVYRIADLLAGKPEANPVIRPGDIVTVMDSKPVYITGSVVAPQPLYLRDGFTLSRALAMVGGPSQNAKPEDVRIYRSELGSTEIKVIRANLNDIKKKKSEDVVLQAYDIIEVPKASDWSPKVLLGAAAKAIMGGATGAPGQILQYRVLY